MIAVTIAEHSAGSKQPHPLPIEALAALEKKAFSRADAWSQDDLRAEAKKTSALLLVATARADPGESPPASTSRAVHALDQRPAAAHGAAPSIVGYLAAASTGTAVHISRVATHPDARRRGVASALVAAALRPDAAITRRRRPLGASLHVDPGNGAAVALYRRVGFREDARLEDYYAVGRGAVRMVL